MLPPGDWHCPNCTCRFCGMASENVSEGDGTTVSALLDCSLCEKKCIFFYLPGFVNNLSVYFAFCPFYLMPQLKFQFWLL